MALALYRKYRSKSLDDIVGQSHVTDVLRRAITTGNIAHAYLLTGPRGIGKTSIARILAHEINGLVYTDESEHLDIIEIDAASNNGVDDVRELRDKARIAPAQAKYKVYIIDEVHMLSKPAFNALLKTLEEPPAHVVFILATTDFDKLPDTIVSRTQRYHLHTISTQEVTTRLRMISNSEHIQIDDTALEIVARHGGGSLRDSISTLDQLQHASGSDKTITAHDVEQALGLATSEELKELLAAIANTDASQIVSHTQAIQLRGVSSSTLASQLINTITTELAKSPGLIRVLEPLMDVARSSHPDTKLLVSLLAGSTPAERPKTVAQAVHMPTAPVLQAPATRAPIPRTSTSRRPATTAPAAVAEVEQPVDNTPLDLSKFDWDATLAHAREHYTALFAILSKCTPELLDDKLILYAGRRFNKTKLDSTKYRPLIGLSLAATGVGTGLEIDIRDTTAPPKDSQAAKIAAMMGGGEEVDV